LKTSKLQYVPMKSQPVKSQLWNDIYDAEALRSDPAEARRVADETVSLVAEGRNARSYRRRADVWGATRTFLGYALVTVLLVGGIANAIYWPLKVHSNDYAHVDPGSVEGAAAEAIRQWYGENDLPANLQVISKEKSSLYGDRAWKVRYRTRTGKLVCAFVWKTGNGSSGEDRNKVAEGKDCA
jgi:hypothetical protein